MAPGSFASRPKRAHVAVGIASRELDGRLDANPALLKMLGYSAEEFRSLPT